MTTFAALPRGTFIATSRERQRTVAQRLANTPSTPKPPEWNGNPCYAFEKKTPGCYTVLLRKLHAVVPFAVMPLQLVNSAGNSGNATRLISARAKQDEPEPLPSTGRATNCTLKPSNSICFARFLSFSSIKKSFRASVWHVLQLRAAALFLRGCLRLPRQRRQHNPLQSYKILGPKREVYKASKVEKLEDEFPFQGLDVVPCITS